MKNLGTTAVYQVYVRSFRDSGGDGFGDLPGVIEKLDYIASLGVDYVWLTPFLKSPQKDNGYDIADYRAIEPVFGTMEDFERLVAEAEKRGLKIMMDMVINHTSTAHEWFQKALAGDEKYLNYYIFRKGKNGQPPTNWNSKFGGSAWEYVPGLDLFYLHLYAREQADLNWDNPAVRKELQDVVNFWIGKGAGGFRFDVINVISKPAVFEDAPGGDGRHLYTDGPNVHAYIRELNENSFGRHPEMLTVAELSSTNIGNCIQYTRPENHEFNTAFQFYHLRIDYTNDRKWEPGTPDTDKLRNTLNEWQTGMQRGGGNMSLFWSNHDQPRIVSRLGDEGPLWKESAKMLATLMYFLNGVPFIYQGEEIGAMNGGFKSIGQYRDVETINHFDILKNEGKTEEEILGIFRQKSRDNGRLPMRWDGSDLGGFTRGTPWIGLGQGTKANVRDEEQDVDSILVYYKRLLGMRKTYPVLSSGTFEPIAIAEKNVYAYRRCLGANTAWIFCNLSRDSLVLDIPGAGMELKGFRAVFGNYADPAVPGQAGLSLKPYEAVVYGNF
ncbi:alpha,alpha-phosphotrehalase [Breznakiella homolactica]|uniref:Alpha,alpha-phosphotrehalase n=1 Tax=Breznakiella homolactica TaxID=2798577 RepID=A0A7T7XKL8_9SPIR|nr:alpha,alpha-phosphotrehalase [Breznakiella homolactica]QQO07918.1 alpha,alpha-phosphotrehalase [Breznakiella homolactica]